MDKISLCVPAYKRPDTLLQLIKSFQKQDYENKELVISDDTPDSSVKDLVKSLNDKSLRYYQNKPGLGFSKNLLKSMERATGDYLVLLGDDDILFRRDALSDYVDIFKNKPKVGFVYSNQVQFSEKLNVEYIIKHTKRNKELKKGQESMKGIWIMSIYIGGIGVRKKLGIKSLYPTRKILHPQVEFIGNLINLSNSYLIDKEHIGFRAHNDQIIFRALKNKKIRQEGEHMTVELLDIFNKLNKKYNLNMNSEFLGQQLMPLQAVMLFKEKANLGSEEMKKNYKKFLKLYPIVNKSYKFKLIFILALLLPSTLFFLLRLLAFKIAQFSKSKKYLEYSKQLAKAIE